MVTGCLKYLLAPAGVGFLYVRRELVERFEPTVTGWFGRINPFAYQIDHLDWPPAASRFESGTPPVMSAAAALGSVGLLDRMGLAAVGAQVDRLVARFSTAAREAGVVVRTPEDPRARGPLVVVQAKDGAALAAELATHGIIASARGDGLRVAFHAYNNDEDADAVIAALEHSSLVERAAPRARI